MLHYTPETLAAEHKRQLELLINKAHNYHFLAKMLGLPPSTVQGWVQRGRISKAGAKLAEEHKELSKDFTAEQLRPDL